MLQHLLIQNYALIDKLEIDFSEGLTIITGETGAGKSILLGALSLVAGQRADTSVLQDRSNKCFVEAEFDIKGKNLEGFFKTFDLDYANNSIIRREISTEGKSRAFINDTPVTLQVLKQLSNSLIDIHSQHENLLLSNEAFQLSVIDSLAKNSILLKEYQKEFYAFKEIDKQLSVLLETEAQSKKDLDYFKFQLDELLEADLKTDEQEALEQELETLNNSETIKLKLTQANSALNGESMNAQTILGNIKNSLSAISKYNNEIEDLYNRINSCIIELKDISSELDRVEEKIIYDPKRIKLITEKLDKLYALQQKHQVKTIAELISISEDLERKVNSISSLDERIEELKKQKTSLKSSMMKLAEKLSEKRKKVLPLVINSIRKILVSLSMPNAVFEVMQKQKEADSNGMDSILFLFSANKGSSPQDISKVASGGELSRLMLSIKSLISQSLSLPTIIFDEIDTGVSGTVADKVGDIMLQMSKGMQVMAITHLPQIASKGTSHLNVYKEDISKTTYTRIKKLSKEERIVEIAKMLSAGQPTNTALKNAKELLQYN